MNPRSLLEIRKSPLKWFQGFGKIRDEETRQPLVAFANILQRRVFEHYRRCQEANKPCRMAVLKYRRAGSSTSGTCLIYMHAMNHEARLGLIGTNYRASHNMMEMVTFYGQHDDFPGWVGGAKEGDFEEVDWEEKTTKIIATRVEFATKSVVELYTAGNPESARSAGLNGYHGTEVGRWATGGQLDAAETLSSMRNTLPKRGFHLALEESTANGAQGSFYDTCRNARWPEYAEWWKQWETDWPLDTSEFGSDLQFVFIFAAWFEDSRHVEELTPEQAKRIEDTLDAEPWYEGEKELIARYEQDGPYGKRLGSEVEATTWEQLAWRRAIIKNVCTRRGLDEFKQEYPSNPKEAFLSSGAPVLDSVGLMEMDLAVRKANAPESGELAVQPFGAYPVWQKSANHTGLVQVWEHPIENCRYLTVWDTIENSEVIKGTGERDRNSVLVLRDAYRDGKGNEFKVKVVARVKSPNQWDDTPLAQLTAELAEYYGHCIIAVESNKGVAAIEKLRDKHKALLYVRRRWAERRQSFTNELGFCMDADSRRQVVSTLQEYVREQRVEVLCPNIVGELKNFIFNTSGRAEGAPGAHDDDVLALGIGLVCLPAATVYRPPALVLPGGAKPERAGGWG